MSERIEPLTDCLVRLQPQASYTRLTPVCGRKAKGRMPDGTPACGTHLRSASALTEHAEAESDAIEPLFDSLVT